MNHIKLPVGFVEGATLSDSIENARQAIMKCPDRLVELHPLPSIAMRVSQACDDPDVDIHELAELVECDPAFATKILSVVNSSIYGYSREICSIRQALVVLGRSNVVQLAMSVAAKAVFAEGQSPELARLALYEHSLACASTARLLTRHSTAPVDPGAAFLAGIFHDVGKLILLDFIPPSYSTLLDSSSSDRLELDDEGELFDTNHAELGGRFADNWGIPVSISHAIVHHHEGQFEKQHPITHTVFLANRLVRHWGLGSAGKSKCPAPKWLESHNESFQDTLKEDAIAGFEETCRLLAG